MNYLSRIEEMFNEAEESAAKATIREGEFMLWNNNGFVLSFGDSTLDTWKRQNLEELCAESLGFILERQISDAQKAEADDFVSALEALAAAMRKKVNEARTKS